MTKEEKEGLIILVFLLAIISMVILTIIRSNKKYEYFIEGQLGYSVNCYEEKGQCYCLKDNEYIKVDSYSE